MLLANYIRIAWRNLRSKTLYSSIKIGSLATGLSVAILILLYMAHELSYDRWQKDSDRIFCLATRIKLDKDTIQTNGYSYEAATMIRDQNKQVESFLRITGSLSQGASIQSVTDPALRENAGNIYFTDPNFFTFFSFRLLEGNKEEVLKHPFSIVISERIARKFFKGASAVGQSLLYNGKNTFLVTGVMEDAPSNANLKADYLMSANSISGIEKIGTLLNTSGNFGGPFNLYLKLTDKSQQAQVAANISRLADASGLPGKALLRPLTSLQKEISPNFRYLSLFPLVAGLVLLMALINYMSLSTARAIGRAKEIAVRKTLGANYKHIAWQFYIESGLYAFIAFGVALVMVLWFNRPLIRYLEVDIDTGFLFQPLAFIIYLGLLAITVLLAGSYPAFILSRYQAAVVKPSEKDKNTRKVMTIVQFLVAGILIVCCVVIREQLDYFRNANTGIEKDRVVMVPFQESMGAHYPAFRQQVAALNGVTATGTARYPLYEGEDMWFINQEKDKSQTLVSVIQVDQALMAMTDMKWKDRPVSNFISDQPKAVVLNETAVKYLKLGDAPVGKFVPFGPDNRQVIGVVKDFNFRSLRSEITPLALFVEKENSTAWGVSNPGCLFIKLGPNQSIPRLLADVKKIFERFDPRSAFEYKFLDETFNKMYRAEDQLRRLFDIFTLLTIIIAASGLLGLATFSAELRTREVGIRKVLGANVSQLVLLLSKEFIKLVFVSLVIATPIAWYLMKQWLQQFAYRTEMKWWMFAVSAALVLTIAIIAVGGQVLKSALRNPVKSLKITSD